jgi:glycerophosphoryl diester phosphodiesterase
MTIAIISHRGCAPNAPENSLAGIRMAAELGADGVEIDVRRAVDGVPVVFHDWSLRRMTGLPGPVQLYPSVLLRRLRLRGSDERIPLLADVLDCLPEGLFAVVDVKDVGAAVSTLRLVRERKLEDGVLFWSNRERAVRYFVREAQEIEVSLTRSDIDPEGVRRFLEDASQIGVQGISADWRAINSQFMGEAHERGLRVYSLNHDLDSVAKKAAVGLDGVVTGHPRQVRAMLEAAAGT